MDFPLGGRFLASNDAQQCGLTNPIRAHDRDPGPVRHTERQARKDINRVERFSEIMGGYKRHNKNKILPIRDQVKMELGYILVSTTVQYKAVALL